MNTSSNPSTSPTQPTQPTKKPSLYPPEPAHNPSIAPPFSKSSFESMTSTLQPTPSSEQDPTASSSPPPPQRPHFSSDYSSNHPFSPFYSHPTTRTSLDQAISASKLNVHVYEHDLESQSRILTTTTTHTTTPSQHPPLPPESTFAPPPPYNNNDEKNQQQHNNNSTNKNKNKPKRISTMWPSIPRCAAHLSTLRHNHNHNKNKNITTGTIRGSRACAPYRRLTGRQKCVLQILLALLVVGAATGLGVGISKAVGAGVWGE